MEDWQRQGDLKAAGLSPGSPALPAATNVHPCPPKEAERWVLGEGSGPRAGPRCCSRHRGAGSTRHHRTEAPARLHPSRAGVLGSGAAARREGCKSGSAAAGNAAQAMRSHVLLPPPQTGFGSSSLALFPRGISRSRCMRSSHPVSCTNRQSSSKMNLSPLLKINASNIRCHPG